MKKGFETSFNLFLTVRPPLTKIKRQLRSGKVKRPQLDVTTSCALKSHFVFLRDWGIQDDVFRHSFFSANFDMR